MKMGRGSVHNNNSVSLRVTVKCKIHVLHDLVLNFLLKYDPEAF